MRQKKTVRVAAGTLSCALALSGALSFAAPTVAWAADGSEDVTSTPTTTQPTETTQSTPVAVTFYAAETEVEGVMSDQVDPTGTGITLASCSYVRAGYHFVGWQALTATGTQTYADGAFVPASDFGEEGLLQLVALWEPNTYTLEFDCAGGVMDVTSLPCTYGEYVTYPVPTRGGHVFTGWALSNGVILDEGNRALLSTFDGDVVQLTATWEPTAVVLSFDPNYPEGTSGPSLDDVTATYGDDAVSLAALELEGYDFLGWDNGSGSLLSPGSHTMAEAFGSAESDTATLIGAWQAHTYAVICDFAGGTVTEGGVAMAASTPIDATYGLAVTLPTPVRKGYELIGWADESGTTYAVDAVANLTAVDGGTVHLTALWQKVADTTSATTTTSSTSSTTTTTTTSTSSGDQTSAAASTDDAPVEDTDKAQDAASLAPVPAAPAEAKVVEIVDDKTAAASPVHSTSATHQASWLKMLPVVAVGVAAVALLGIAFCLIRPDKAGRRKDGSNEGKHYGGQQ